MMPFYSTASKLLKLPPQHRKTFQWSTPSDTHWRIVDCRTAAEYGECKHFAAGFLVPVDPDAGRKEEQKARYKAQGYRFWEGDAPPIDGYPTGLRVFLFPPEQRCFNSRENPHRISLNRPPALSVVGGDWRGNPRNEKVVHTRIEDWVNDLQNNIGAINDEVAKG